MPQNPLYLRVLLMMVLASGMLYTSLYLTESRLGNDSIGRSGNRLVSSAISNMPPPSGISTSCQHVCIIDMLIIHTPRVLSAE